MTELSQTILQNWQVRRTKRQKTAFIDFMKQQFPGLSVEEGGFGKNRNLVLGDVKNARVILTAHYDTCARMIVPNFIPPKNFLLYIGYSLLLCVPIFFIIGVLNYLISLVTDNFMIAYWGSFLPGMALMFWMFMGGKPNPHTANDNTSGVISLVEIYASMTEEQKKQTALVFFDNEENGLLGSAWFAKKHKKEGLKDKLVLNFDCVSDGDHILFVQNKPAKQRYGAALAAAFPETDAKKVHLASAATTFFPSDQANFPVNMAVSAMNRSKLVGLYMNKIHTPRDTVFDERNIEFLRCGTLRMLDSIL